MKLARKWNDMTFEQQVDYLKHHRKSRQRPTSDPLTTEVKELAQIMGGYNKMVEGKEFRVKQQFDEWVNKLQDLGFEGNVSENEAVLNKDGVSVNVNMDKGKMRYYAHFEIKPTFTKAASYADWFIKNLKRQLRQDPENKRSENMPNFDQTGPMGEGPCTGKEQGKCECQRDEDIIKSVVDSVTLHPNQDIVDGELAI